MDLALTRAELVREKATKRARRLILEASPHLEGIKIDKLLGRANQQMLVYLDKENVARATEQLLNVCKRFRSSAAEIAANLEYRF